MILIVCNTSGARRPARTPVEAGGDLGLLLSCAIMSAPSEQKSGDPLATPAAHQMTAWTLRLAESETFRWQLAADPHLFALLYATCAAAVPPPKRLAADRGESVDIPEKLLPTLKDLQRQLGSDTSGRFARLYLRGVGVFPSLDGDDVAYMKAIGEWRSCAEARASAVITAQERNVDWIAGLLGLRALERKLLTFHLNLHRPGFSQLFELLMDSDHACEVVLGAAFGVAARDVIGALAEGSTLVRSGLLGVERRPLYVSEPSAHLRATLDEYAADEEVLIARFLEPLKPSPSTASLARLDGRDRELLLRIVKASMPEEHGLHALVYGPASIDKRDMLARLFQEERVAARAVVTKHVPPGDLPAWVHIAQRHLSRSEPDAVLLVDRAHDALASRRTGVLSFFGFDDEDRAEDEDERASDEGLTGSRVRCVWLTERAERLSERNLGAFLFHCEALPGSRAARRERVTQVVSDYGLSERLERRLAKYSLLGEQQVRQATRLALLAATPNGGTGGLATADMADADARGGDREQEGAGAADGEASVRERVIERAVAQAQRALGRDRTEDLRDSITKYNLDLLNISGRFTPTQIIEALRKRPKASLLFWGIPGAGKTQLAEHIAVELDLPLMMRSASDLLSKWLGETEQRLAAMFTDATNEGAMLFLDEADSFLRDRALARAEWSVTQVNELLQKMERFDGVFVAATNLMDSVDAAAMRRFTWKLEFKALEAEQAWSMFCAEAPFDAAGDPDRAAALRGALAAIPDLTPGDFATVKRQADVLGERLSPEAWLEQLAVEAKAKMAGLRRQKPGFAA